MNSFEEAMGGYEKSRAVEMTSSPLNVCATQMPGFDIHKSVDSYSLLYRGKLVWQMRGNRLLHDIWGNTQPDVVCDGPSTSEVASIRCGWKHDLLIAFGVIQSGGLAKAVRVLYWFPHDGTMTITPNGSNQLLVQYGNQNDLRKRLCWNTIGNEIWMFSYDIRSGRFEPCSIDRQENTSQFTVAIDGPPHVEG